MTKPAMQIVASARQICKVYFRTPGGQALVQLSRRAAGDPERDLALTLTRLPGGGATIEVARRQADGSWRWVIDHPAVLP